MELKEILAEIKSATGIDPVAFNITDETELPAISYLFYRDGDDGAVTTYRMQTRITADSYAEALDIEGRLTDAMVTVGDSTLHDCVIAVNGGGSLQDATTGWPQIITYFDITTRS